MNAVSLRIRPRISVASIPIAIGIILRAIFPRLRRIVHRGRPIAGRIEKGPASAADAEIPFIIANDSDSAIYIGRRSRSREGVWQGHRELSQANAGRPSTMKKSDEPLDHYIAFRYSVNRARRGSIR